MAHGSCLDSKWPITSTQVVGLAAASDGNIPPATMEVATEVATTAPVPRRRLRLVTGWVSTVLLLFVRRDVAKAL
ncbi:hypothetical protein GCM10025789_21240 [Tessaracoccus lubricantis]|uniref:Uncharacterized protein n=1 Tax=Tessaracoccus lubricantis TaxID=545543 RepID=A0ABP9FQQ2_9ACTN